MLMNSEIRLLPERKLTHLWHSICNSQIDLDLPSAQWIRKWSCNQASANRLYQGIALFQPQIIVETGTFEGLGTFTMARAAHANNNGAHIYTIDYDGDPTTQLPEKEWLQLREIRQNNLNSIRQEFPNVQITFIEGDSRKVLPELLAHTLDHWDFFYQDSMHFRDGILAEWQLMRAYSRPGSVVLFDDIALENRAAAIFKEILGMNDQFPEYFYCHEVIKGDWKCESIIDDHPQFWAQRI